MAPWVVIATRGATTYLLGPNLAVLRLTGFAGDRRRLATAVVDSLGVDAALAGGFVQSPRCEEQWKYETGSTPDHVGVVVREQGFPVAACTALCDRLRAVGGGNWLVREPSAIGPDDRATVLRAVNREPREPLSGLAVLRVGEAFEGTYITGPVTGGDGDAGRFARDWAFEARLDEIGFRGRPVPLLHRINRDPLGVARAVAMAATLRPDEAVLLHDGRVVDLASTTALARSSFHEVTRRQSWTFGIARGLAVEPGAIVGSHIATCRTPAAREERLEGNSGKGSEETEAIHGAVGEALERFAAYEANWSLRPARTEDPVIALDDLHPYGPDWERHQEVGLTTDVVFVEGVNLADGAPVAVPKAMVTFPDVGTPRVSAGSTTGLAAGRDLRDTTLRALREVLERDRLYVSFTRQFPGIRLDVEPAVTRLGLAGSLRGDVWAVHWPHEGFSLPDVHVFYRDRELGLFVRASGSGISFEEAVESALIELCQVHFEAVRARRAGTSTSPAHAAWTTPEVIAQASAYLTGLPFAHPAEPPYEDASGQYRHLVDALHTKGTVPVRIQLPLRGEDWLVVRVVVPGATTTPYPSRSAGGGPLLNPPWPHGIPT